MNAKKFNFQIPFPEEKNSVSRYDLGFDGFILSPDVTCYKSNLDYRDKF